MTQPPLSRQIQKLEKHVGVTLLKRDNRTVELTTAGTAFLQEARLILNSSQKATERARAGRSRYLGAAEYRIYSCRRFFLLGPILNKLHEHIPNVSIDFL